MQNALANYPISNDKPFTLIAGPCVVESEAVVFQCAEEIKRIAETLGIQVIFKASLDKANRTSDTGFRGIGVDKALAILKAVKTEFALPVITDVHHCAMVEQVADVVDFLQIPAFLCRQTDLIRTACQTGLPVNIKKGQFLAPGDMRHVLGKALSTGNPNIMLCERGTTFGYNNLVVDFRGLAMMREMGYPVVFDATHSVQLPGAGNGQSSGQREYASVLARAALTVGIAAIFAETHPNPEQAMSDGPNSIPLHELQAHVQGWIAIDKLVKTELSQAGVAMHDQVCIGENA